MEPRQAAADAACRARQGGLTHLAIKREQLLRIDYAQVQMIGFPDLDRALGGLLDKLVAAYS